MKKKADKLFPLLDEIEESAEGVLSNKIISSDHYIIKDHVINNNVLLPGIFQIEMALETAFYASNLRMDVKSVYWVQPVFIREKTEIITRLTRKENKFYFEILSDNKIRSRGWIVSSNTKEIKNNFNTEKIKRDGRKISKDILYKTLDKKGFKYGQKFQGLKSLFVLEDEIFSEVTIKNSEIYKEYILPPTLIDSSLQSITGFLFNNDRELKSYFIPYSVEKISILNNSQIENISAVHTKLIKKDKRGLIYFQIALINESYESVIQIDNFCIRIIDNLGVLK